MKSEIFDCVATAENAELVGGEKAKLSYQKPKLQKFGSLRKLTLGLGSGDNEAGGTGIGNRRQVGPSDRALKEDIVRIGTHSPGIDLYLFNFKPEYRDSCGQGRQFGVMADEVEQVMPEAVSTGANGFKVVNYQKLGIDRYTD